MRETHTHERDAYTRDKHIEREKKREKQEKRERKRRYCPAGLLDRGISEIYPNPKNKIERERERKKERERESGEASEILPTCLTPQSISLAARHTHTHTHR